MAQKQVSFLLDSTVRAMGWPYGAQQGHESCSLRCSFTSVDCYIHLVTLSP